MKIIEIQLLTNRLSELKEFYEKLGLQLISEASASFTFKTGASKITFNQSAEPAYYHFAFNIPENKIYEAIEWLKTKDIDLIEYEDSPIIDFVNWNAHSVYFYDAAGNIVELIARHNLNNPAEEKFNSQMLLCVSEIGLPVEKVYSFLEILENKLNQKLWWGNTETFAAVGDEEGLFIAVTGSRNWFPTEKLSIAFPAVIKIHGESNGFLSPPNTLYKIITSAGKSDLPDELEPIRNFLDKDLRIKSYPSNLKQKSAVIEYLVEKFEKDKKYSQKEIDNIIDLWHTFNDHALLRRELIESGLLKRTSDGSQYWKN